MAFFRGAAVDRLGEKKNKQSAGMTPHFTLFKGHPATPFCKITVRRSKYCLEISKA